MIALSTRTRGALVVLAGISLAGCISLFPKEIPSQLYRFGFDAAPVDRPSAPAAGNVAIQAAPTGFDRPAAGDAILAITGEQAAYLKGARWVAPAPTLFDDAVTHAFDANPGPARLITRGEGTRPDYLMKLDVRTFELHYDQGLGEPPTVVIELFAALTRASDRSPTGERFFRAAVPASENRAGAITEGFDRAMRKILGDLVAWANERAVA